MLLTAKYISLAGMRWRERMVPGDRAWTQRLPVRFEWMAAAPAPVSGETPASLNAS